MSGVWLVCDLIVPLFCQDVGAFLERENSVFDEEGCRISSIPMPLQSG